MRLTDLPTPAVLVEQSRIERNVDRMQAAADHHNLRLRPHAKTHKSIDFARIQIGRGAVGIACAKLGEAEVFADAGIEDIRLPYPLNPVNAPRVIRLLDRTRFSFIVDHPVVARHWSDAMTRAAKRVDVLVKVDVGFHRCGVDPEDPRAIEVARAAADTKGLRLRGILSHAGHAYDAKSVESVKKIAAAEAETMTELASRWRTAGLPIEEISVGSTPTARHSASRPGLAELRPGNYVYYDRTQVALGAATLDHCALTVLVTVVSKPKPDRVIFDCGSKTLSSDRASHGSGLVDGFGDVFLHPHDSAPEPSLLVERLSEEHATVRVRSGSTPLVPGDRVRLLPNHACVISNLFDYVHLVEGDEVVERLPVAARGRVA